MFPEAPLPFELASAARRRAARRSRRARVVPPRHGQRSKGKGLGQAREPTAYSPTQREGMRGERAAGRFLASQGLTILGQNLRARTGEIDLAADDGGVLVFVEVRLRSSASHGGAVASIDAAKRGRLVRTAQAWLPILAARHYSGRMPPCRFDAVGLDNGALTWIRNAFAAES